MRLNCKWTTAVDSHLPDFDSSAYVNAHASATPRLDLSPKQLELVITILKNHIPAYPVLAFGSRVTGQARKYSDLDLAVIAPQALRLQDYGVLNEAFEASDQDICVDIVDWPRASPEFRRCVEQSGMVRLR